jgi:transposase-like protein
MTDARLDRYCPACAETASECLAEGESVTISPGEYRWVCPSCDTAFTIRVEYVPEENGESPHE